MLSGANDERATNEPRRILLLGDSHAEMRGLTEAIAQASDERCDALVSVGDLGYWPRFGWGQRFLKSLRRALVRAEFDLFFVEGNHDDLASLALGRHRQFGAFRQVVRPPRGAARGGLFHIPRGSRWSWSGVRFLGVGGGFSIDHYLRCDGEDWFSKAELISQKELDAIVADRSTVDVVIAHDCPAGLPWLNSFAPIAESQRNGACLATICAAVQPLQIVHGHYHLYHRTLQHDPIRGIHALVTGLDCLSDDSNHRSVLLLDLPGLAAGAEAERARLYGS